MSAVRALLVWAVVSDSSYYLRICSRQRWVCLTPSYSPPLHSVVDVPEVNCQETHIGWRNVLPSLPRPANRSLHIHHKPSRAYTPSRNRHRPFFPHVHATSACIFSSHVQVSLHTCIFLCARPNCKSGLVYYWRVCRPNKYPELVLLLLTKWLIPWSAF